MDKMCIWSLVFGCGVLVSVYSQAAPSSPIDRVGTALIVNATYGYNGQPGTLFLLPYPLPRNGVLFAFSAFVVSTSKTRLQLWRPAVAVADQFQLIGEVSVTPTTTGQKEDIYMASNAGAVPCLLTQPNDRIGIYHEAVPGAIGYMFKQEASALAHTTSTPFNITDSTTFKGLPFPYEFMLYAYIDTNLQNYTIDAGSSKVPCLPTVFIPVPPNVTTTSTTTSAPVTGGVGATGATGAAGGVGATGIAGATGSPGSTGPNGLQGATGLQGANGAIGATGVEGPTGAPGTAGATGLIGPAGATGATGQPGTQGATGSTGPVGSNGTIGPKGDKGDVGATGPIGPPGPPGALNMTSPSAVPILSAAQADFYNQHNFPLGLFIWLILLSILVLIIILLFSICLCCLCRKQKKCDKCPGRLLNTQAAGFNNSFKGSTNYEDINADVEGQQHPSFRSETRPPWVNSLKSTSESVFTNNVIEDGPDGLDNPTYGQRKTPKNSSSSYKKEGRTEF